MKIFYKQSLNSVLPVEEELTTLDLRESIEKTRAALEIAYAGFNNALETDLIDSYIYEITALSKRYEHLTALAGAKEAKAEEPLYSHPPVRTLIGHVFG